MFFIFLNNFGRTVCFSRNFFSVSIYWVKSSLGLETLNHTPVLVSCQSRQPQSHRTLYLTHFLAKERRQTFFRKRPLQSLTLDGALVVDEIRFVRPPFTQFLQHILANQTVLLMSQYSFFDSSARLFCIPLLRGKIFG